MSRQTVGPAKALRICAEAPCGRLHICPVPIGADDVTVELTKAEFRQAHPLRCPEGSRPGFCGCDAVEAKRALGGQRTVRDGGQQSLELPEA